MVLIHLFFLSAQLFDQKPGSTLIYFFYLYTTIQQKYVVLFHLFLFLCTIIRPKVRVLIDFFIICTRPVGQIMRSSFIHSFCARPFDLKLGSSLIYFFHLHTTIRQKYMIVFHLFFLCAKPFDQKLGSSLIHFFFYLYTTIQPKLSRGHSYSLIYPFFNCANISFAIFMTVLPLYFVRSISGSTAFIFRPLYS